MDKTEEKIIKWEVKRLDRRFELERSTVSGRFRQGDNQIEDMSVIIDQNSKDVSALILKFEVLLEHLNLSVSHRKRTALDTYEVKEKSK